MTKLDLIDTTIQPDPFKPQAGDVYEFGHPFTQRLVVEDAPSVGDFRVRFRIDGGDSSLTSVRAFHLLLAGFRGLRGIGRVVEMTAENAAVWARSKRAERAEEHANPDLAPFANLSVADIAHAAWLCGYGPGDEPMQVFKLAAARAAEWQEIEGATRQIAMANPGSPLKVPAVVSKLIGEHAATVAKAHRADCALEALGWDGEKDPLAWSRTAREPACKALGIPTDSTFTLPEIVADLAAKALEADGRPNVSLWTVQAALTKLAGSPGRGLCAELVAEAIGLMREDVAALPEADPLAYTLHRALQRGVSVGMSWSGKADDEQHAKACAEVDKLGDPEQVAQLKGLRPWAMVRELVGRLVQECRNLDDARAKLVSEQVDVSERRMALEAVQSSLRAAMFSALGHEDSTLSVLDLVEQLVHAIRERDEQINTLSSQRDRFFDDYTIVAKREKATAARLTATERRIADGDNAIQALLTLGWTSDDDPREWACNEGREVDLLKQRVATYEEDFGSLIAAGWTNGHPVKWAQDKFAELTKERDEARQFGSGLEAALVAAQEEIRMLRDREDVARLDRTSTAAWMQSSPLDCLDDSPDIRCWPATGIVIPGSAGPVLTIMPEDGGSVAIVHMEDVAAWLQAYNASVAATKDEARIMCSDCGDLHVRREDCPVERHWTDCPKCFQRNGPDTDDCVAYHCSGCGHDYVPTKPVAEDQMSTASIAEALGGTVMARTKVADLVVTVLVVKNRIVVLKQRWASEDSDFDAASVSLQDDDPRGGGAEIDSPDADHGGRRTVQQAQEFEQQAVTNLRRALGAKPYTKVDDFEILVDREVRMRSACLEVLDPMSDESTLDLVERLATSLKAMAARLAATERRIADSDNAVQALTSLGWPRDTDPREWASMLARMALQDGRDQAATRESDLRQQLAARDGTHGLSELALLFVEDAVKSALKIRTDCATETEAELERFLRREQHVLDRESDLQDVDLIRQRVATCPYCDAWEWHQADVARLRAEIAMLRDNDEVICPDRTTKAAWMLPKANPSATVPDHLWAVERFGDDADALHGTAMARTKVADLVVTVLVVKSRIVVQKQKWTSEYPDFDAASVSLQDDDPRFSSGMGLGDRAGTWTWRGTTSGTTEWAGEWASETSVLAAGVIADLGRKDLIRVDGVATEHIHCLVGEPLMLSNADDAGVTSWRWSVVAPQTSDPKRRWSWGKPHFSFTTDVLGDYTVHLHVVREGSEQELTLTVRAS